MKVEIIATRKLTDDEMRLLLFKRPSNNTRRMIIKAAFGGAALAFAPLMFKPSSFTAKADWKQLVAQYFIRGLKVAKDTVPVSEEIRNWATLINGGGDENKQQNVLIKLVARDGAAEDETSKPIAIDPNQMKIVRAVARAQDPGSKTIQWETDDDQSSIAVDVVDS